MAEEFIGKSQKKHPGIFDYSKVKYINCDMPVILRCIQHDYNFNIHPRSHLSKKSTHGGCILCKPPKKGGAPITETHSELVNTEWDTEKNATKGWKPENFSKGMNVNVYWKCDKVNCENKCPHSYLAEVANKCRKKKSGCPICKNDIVCLCKSIWKRHNNLIKTKWDKKNNKGLNPKKIGEGSGIRAKWICGNNECKQRSYKRPIRAEISSRKCPNCNKRT